MFFSWTGRSLASWGGERVLSGCAGGRVPWERHLLEGLRGCSWTCTGADGGLPWRGSASRWTGVPRGGAGGRPCRLARRVSRPAPARRCSRTVRPGRAVCESVGVVSRFLVLSFGPSWRWVALRWLVVGFCARLRAFARFFWRMLFLRRSTFGVARQGVLSVLGGRGAVRLGGGCRLCAGAQFLRGAIERF